VNPSDTSGGFNQFTLNGANITQQTTYNAANAGTWTIAPTLDAIQEVNVMDTTYDARFGRTSGGTVTVEAELRNRGSESVRGVALRPLASTMLDVEVTPPVIDMPGSVTGQALRRIAARLLGEDVPIPDLTERKAWFANVLSKLNFSRSNAKG
jgi:hypothetical protein